MNKQESKKLELKVLNTLKRYIQKNDTVVAGISGGPDSVFLLHHLQKLPNKTIVAHIDHQLRKDSQKDATFVKTISPNFHLKTVDIQKIARKSKQGLEETGRKIRYQFFQQLAKKYKAKYILTAHQADENLETVILNFSRGAGLQGLCGMAEVEGNLLRPLLQISKSQILKYLKYNKIPFQNDKSNKDLKFSRNFIRQTIIPKLKKLNPNIIETMAKNSQNLRELNEHIKLTAQRWLMQNRPHKLNAKTLRQQPRALQKVILLEAYKKLIGNTNNLETIHLDEVIKIIQNNVGNKQKKLGKLTLRIKNNIIELK